MSMTSQWPFLTILPRNERHSVFLLWRQGIITPARGWRERQRQMPNHAPAESFRDLDPAA